MKNSFALIVLFISSIAGLVTPSIDEASCKNWSKILKSDKEVQLSGITVQEDLIGSQLWPTDHSTNTIAQSIDFQTCKFNSTILLENKVGGRIKVKGDVVFDGCEFLEEVHLDDMIIEGRLIIRNCVFHKSLLIQRSKIIGGMRILDNEVGNDLNLGHTLVQDDWECMDNHLGRNLLCQGISVRGKTRLSVNQAQGLDLTLAHFHEDFHSRYMELEQKVSLNRSHFHSFCTVLDVSGNAAWTWDHCHFNISPQLDNKIQ